MRKAGAHRMHHRHVGHEAPDARQLQREGQGEERAEEQPAQTICSTGTPCWPRYLAITSRNGSTAMAVSIRPMPSSSGRSAGRS